MMVDSSPLREHAAQNLGRKIMDRRSLLFGFFGIASAAASAAIVASRAEATPLEAIRNLSSSEIDAAAEKPYGQAPDGTPAEDAY
jgi:uncharacterized membrane protein